MPTRYAQNLPTDQRVPAFAVHVVALCMTHRASVTSWYRTSTRNKSKGGSINSFHLEGLAADLVPDNPIDGNDIMHDAHQRGLDAVNEGDHVHVELDYRGARLA